MMVWNTCITVGSTSAKLCSLPWIRTASRLGCRYVLAYKNIHLRFNFIWLTWVWHLKPISKSHRFNLNNEVELVLRCWLMGLILWSYQKLMKIYYIKVIQNLLTFSLKQPSYLEIKSISRKAYKAYYCKIIKVTSIFYLDDIKTHNFLQVWMWPMTTGTLVCVQTVPFVTGIFSIILILPFLFPLSTKWLPDIADGVKCRMNFISSSRKWDFPFSSSRDVISEKHPHSVFMNRDA